MVKPKPLQIVTIAPAQRPKRGRRRKRPELSHEQRRTLRALQTRQATRRSRERTKAKAEELKTQLKLAEIQRETTEKERDCVLVREIAYPEHSSDSGQTRRNPMSLSVILNNDEDTNNGYVFTPPSKRYRAMFCDASSVSMSSPSSQRLAFQNDCA